MRALGIAPEAMFKKFPQREGGREYPQARLQAETSGTFWSVDIKEMASDESQQIVNLQKWRDAYPNALSAVLSSTATFPSEDGMHTWLHLRSVHYLHLNGNPTRPSSTSRPSVVRRALTPST